MKKKFTILTILICTNVFLSAQNSFKDFVYKNPFLDDLEVYIENPDLLRNKIFKTVTEEYDLTVDGKKKYGDSYTTNKGIKYFFFDENNILQKKVLLVTQNEKIITKQIWKYIDNGNSYLVSFYNYDYNEKKNEEYSCYHDKSECTTLKYYEAEIEFTKEIKMTDGKKIITEQKFSFLITNPFFVFVAQKI